MAGLPCAGFAPGGRAARREKAPRASHLWAKLRGRVERRSGAVAASGPRRDRAAQLVGAADRRIVRVSRRRLEELLDDERRHRLARLADRQIDRLGVTGGRCAEQPAQLREGGKDGAVSERREAGGRNPVARSLIAKSWGEL